MTLANWFQLGALLIALVSLIWQQHKAFNESKLKEKRIETKLRIFYAIADADRDEDAVISILQKGQPLKETDKVEIRKSLYEMLSDETVRFTRDGKYKPRERTPRDVKGGQ